MKTTQNTIINRSYPNLCFPSCQRVLFVSKSYYNQLTTPRYNGGQSLITMKRHCCLFGADPTHLLPKKYSHGRMCGITQPKKEGNKTKQASLPAAFQGCLIKTVPNCSRKLLSPFNRKLHGAFEHFTSSVGTDWLGAERSERTGRLKNILIVFFFSKNARSAVGLGFFF